MSKGKRKSSDDVEGMLGNAKQDTSHICVKGVKKKKLTLSELQMNLTYKLPSQVRNHNTRQKMQGVLGDAQAECTGMRKREA